MVHSQHGVCVLHRIGQPDQGPHEEHPTTRERLGSFICSSPSPSVTCCWAWLPVEQPLSTPGYSTPAVPSGPLLLVLSFYIVSAAYRASREVRDAAILLISGIIVLLGNAPIGEVIYPGFGTATKWIMDIANTSAMRAVIFGATIGSFITAIRSSWALTALHGYRRIGVWT